MKRSRQGWHCTSLGDGRRAVRVDQRLAVGIHGNLPRATIEVDVAAHLGAVRCFS